MTNLIIFSKNARGSNYGIGTYFKQLSSFLNPEEYSILFVCLSYTEKEFKIEEKQQMKYIHIPIPTFNSNDQKSTDRYYQSVIYLLSPYINPEKKSIFHLNYIIYGNFVEKIKSKWTKSKIILTIHYQEWCFAINGNGAYYKQIIQNNDKYTSTSEIQIYDAYQKECDLFHQLDKIICLSQYTKQLLENTYHIEPDKLVVILNGLADAGSNSISFKKTQQIKQRYSIQTDEKVILFVGRLDQIKGVEYLIKAFKIVLKSYDGKVKLIIVGDGEYNKLIAECNPIWDHIIFTGKLDQQTLRDFYRMADIGVSPSFHEQCSYVGIEMMMHGVPCIGTTSTGLNEMIENGRNGHKIVLRESGEKIEIPIKKLASVILSYLTNKTISRKSCRDLYKEKYTIEAMKINYMDLYTSINK